MLRAIRFPEKFGFQNWRKHFKINRRNKKQFIQVRFVPLVKTTTYLINLKILFYD
jgi:hypothetical protein